MCTCPLGVAVSEEFIYSSSANYNRVIKMSMKLITNQIILFHWNQYLLIALKDNGCYTCSNYMYDMSVLHHNILDNLKLSTNNLSLY